MIIILLKRTYQKSLKKNLIVWKKNTEKHKTFLAPTAKGVKKTDKHGEEIIKTTSYKLQLIDSPRFL